MAKKRQALVNQLLGVRPPPWGYSPRSILEPFCYYQCNIVRRRRARGELQQGSGHRIRDRGGRFGAVFAQHLDKPLLVELLFLLH